MDFDAARRAAAAYDPAVWETRIREAYGPAAPGILEMEAAARKNETQARLTRIDAMEAAWPQVTALLEELPASRTVAELLRSLDSPCLPAQIGVEGELLKNTFLYCKEVRARYTILQMLWDLDLLAPLSEAVIRELETL